jgi:hypothetical protein
MKKAQPIINQTDYKINWFQKLPYDLLGGEISIFSEKHRVNGISLVLGGVYCLQQSLQLSAGYTMFTVFDNIWTAIGFGILWGLMIFNLDRYIVYKKQAHGGIKS